MLCCAGFGPAGVAVMWMQGAKWDATSAGMAFPGKRGILPNYTLADSASVAVYSGHDISDVLHE